MSIYETNLDQNLANQTVLSPLSFLERSRKTFPDQIAIEYEDYKLTYKQAAKRCNALSKLLKSHNVSKNDDGGLDTSFCLSDRALGLIDPAIILEIEN